MHLSQNEVKKGYALLIKDVRNLVSTHADDVSVLDAIDKAAIYVQQFNWIYTDEYVENILSEISLRNLSVPEHYEADQETVVIFDDWCTSYVLALQYVEALSIHFKKVVYMTARNLKTMPYNNIVGRLKSYNNVSIEVLPQTDDRLSLSQSIIDLITRYKCSKLFLHIGYNSPIVLSLYVLKSMLDVYLINLGDQVFWLGRKGIDYSIEFRPFGATVSHEKRGLQKEQLLYVPFYPVNDNNQFQGFPECVKGKIILFSGGDFYKTLDPEYTYWSLVKSILIEHPNSVLLYATKNIMGKTKQFLDKFVRENKFEQRFIYIGFRSDIYEVMRHCDIFLGTCPVCGSLISQLAAINKKPILQYYLPDTYDDETEQAICHNINFKISYDNKIDFLNEAHKLIIDEDYRNLLGERLYNSMFSKDQFNELLGKVVKTNKSSVNFKSVDFKEVAKRWWWCEKMEYYNTTQHLFVLMGKYNCMRRMPTLALKYYMGRILKKLYVLMRCKRN